MTLEPLSELAKADYLGISRMQINRVRRGVAQLPPNMARKLAALDRKKVKVASTPQTAKEE